MVEVDDGGGGAQLSATVQVRFECESAIIEPHAPGGMPTADQDLSGVSQNEGSVIGHAGPEKATNVGHHSGLGDGVAQHNVSSVR